jgi:hypothetical protein
MGRFALGGWLFLLSGILDTFDGRLARSRNTVTPAGAGVTLSFGSYPDGSVLNQYGVAEYRPGQPLPEGSRATDDKGGADMIKRWLSDDVLGRVQQLTPVADELGITMAQLALAWVLKNSNVASAIIGASRPDQVVSNVEAVGVTLADDVVARIDEILGDVPTRDPALTSSIPTRIV